uniref:Uncharacterized protein n=1 Tax=Anguilla anguilla TaxID=7936 RepID=A0A0E9PWU1_ANGAN
MMFGCVSNFLRRTSSTAAFTLVRSSGGWVFKTSAVQETQSLSNSVFTSSSSRCSYF